MLIVYLLWLSTATSLCAGLYGKGVKNATIEAAPWQVSVLLNDDHICGGVILRRRIILTAAKCVQDPGKLTVRAGSSRRNSGGLVFLVRRFEAHPNLSMKPIKLATSSLNIGAKAEVSGWGEMGFYLPDADQLQQSQIAIGSLEICAKKLALDSPNNTIMCADMDQEDNDICPGDYGGPVTYKQKLYGIMNTGHGCGYTGLPSVFTNVAELKFWIEKTADRLEDVE